MSATPAGAKSVRSALVTGASSGIGAATAIAFGALGWRVALGARRTDRLDEAARAVEKAGGQALAHPLDVTEPESIERFFTAAESAHGPLDVVVSNAGTGAPGHLWELEPDVIAQEVTTNLLGPMWVVRRAVPGMLARGSGDLVFVGSLNSVLPRPLQSGYTAAKSGVEALAATLRMELEGTGVRATTIRPGPTHSEMGRSWEPGIIKRILESWAEWGVLRHHNYLPAERIARAIVEVVTAPPDTHYDVVQLNPQAPA